MVEDQSNCNYQSNYSPRPFAERFRDWLQNSVQFTTDVDLYTRMAIELEDQCPECTKGFPYWFILKKLGERRRKEEDKDGIGFDPSGPSIRSEAKMSALEARWAAKG
jgi:hypothetical protein